LYQRKILEELFSDEIISASAKSGGKTFDGKQKEPEGEYVLLSGMKNRFYKGLGGIKKELYKTMAEEALFDGNPERVRLKWAGVVAVLEVVTGLALLGFSMMTNNFGPIILFLALSLPAIAIVFFMPRKTAKGYGLHRQIKGLAWYLGKGKWRHEITEKNLFLEEMLPLAISLGVVKKLARDMEEIGAVPPSYMQGFAAGNIYSGLIDFEKSTRMAALQGASKSGRSGWSGGSGFGGGGFSGGGFGGGGGGSW
jgi:uncharacterized membrane protein YgcG